MSGENIFSALAKYNSATDENYLTESFVFLLNSLLTKERATGVALLNHLCIKNNECAFEIEEDISVTTQEVTEQGTPDIKVSTPTKLIYIEVKHDSGLGHQQISRYKTALEASIAPTKHVILLTRFAIDIEKQSEKPFKHIRWFEIYNWLANSNVEDSITVYLIESFKSFLEAKQMSIQKVGWEYINGVPAFNNLINMIEVAIEGAQLKVYQKSAAWDKKGFYVESTEFWCGTGYDNPLLLTFQMTKKTKYNKEILKTHKYELREGRYRLWFRLPLEEIHFFSLDKDQQLEETTKFIKTAYSDAQRMRIEKK